MNADRSFAAAFCVRRSTSRTLSRYPSRTALSPFPRLPFRLCRALQDQIQQAVRACVDGRALLRRVALTEQLEKDLPRIRLHRQRRFRVAERQRGIVSAATGRRLHGGFRRDFERGQRRLLPDDFRDHLIESRGHMRAGRAGIRTGRAEPRGGRKRMHRTRGGGILQVPERRHVLLVRLQRRKDRTEREGGTGTGRRPPVQRRTVRRIPHDRAVGNIEESGPQFRNRRGLGERRAGRHHRIQERQRQRHSGGLQNGSARNMFLRDEH